MEVSPDEYASMLKGQGVPDDLVTLLFYLFTTVLDGRNAYLTDGVQRHWDARPGTLSTMRRRLPQPACGSTVR